MQVLLAGTVPIMGKTKKRTLLFILSATLYLQVCTVLTSVKNLEAGRYSSEWKSYGETGILPFTYPNPLILTYLEEEAVFPMDEAGFLKSWEVKLSHDENYGNI